MTIPTPRVRAFAALVVLSAARLSLAQVTASTLVVTPGVPQGYDRQWAFWFDGLLGWGADEFGFRFTPTLSGGLTSARASIFASGRMGDGLVRMSVRADENGQPGAIVGSWTIAPTYMSSNMTPPPSATLDGSIFVQSGTPYWLIATSWPAGPFSWAWHEGGLHGTLPSAPNALRRRGQSVWEITDLPNNPAGGYELTVPAPGVLVAACAGMVITQRRQRGAARTQRTPTRTAPRSA